MNHTAKPEDVKLQLMMFTSLLRSVSMLIPKNDSTSKLIKVVDLLISISSQDWFAGLITFLLNTFENKPVTEENLSEALTFYGNKIEEGHKPVTFTKE